MGRHNIAMSPTSRHAAASRHLSEARSKRLRTLERGATASFAYCGTLRFSVCTFARGPVAQGIEQLLGWKLYRFRPMP